MSKKGYISRYLLIVKKLKSHPYSSYEELKSYIERQIDYLQTQDDTLNIGFSQRTLQRDIREIKNLFGLDIEFSRYSKGYHIIHDEAENMNFQKMIEAFDTFNSLNMAQDIKPFIHLEKQRPQATEFLYELLHAIRNRFQIKFIYHKFWDDEPSARIGDPFVLKEFKNRWYVILKDKRDNKTKTFALDRISNLEITNIKYNQSSDFDVVQKFKYCFGIMNPNDEEPQDIVLSFEPLQGKYIKTLPMHETQEILVDNEHELRISLKLFVTFDLVMELLSHGDGVKVIQPPSLIEEVKSAHKKAYKQYN
jgi:proteasome accessory factor B